MPPVNTPNTCKQIYKATNDYTTIFCIAI